MRGVIGLAVGALAMMGTFAARADSLPQVMGPPSSETASGKSQSAADPGPGGLPDAEIRRRIIVESISHVWTAAEPCPCPFMERNGAACGQASLYTRAGPTAVQCYPHDIPADQVAVWRHVHH